MPAPRVTDFPADYPRQPPINKEIIAANYDRGGEFEVNGIRVIVLRDDRLPVVSWNLTLRGGSHAEPAGKDGLANLTASMMTVGSADLTQEQFATDLANRGISLNVSDGGDVTTVSGSSLVSQLDHAILRTRQVLLEPRFDAGEFERLKLQSMSGLMQSLVNGTTVAQRELSTQLFGESPLGRQTTLDSLRSISLEDIKQWYATVYKPKDAILVFAGAIDTDTARAAAGRLLADFTEGAPPLATYDLPAPSGKRTIVLVDNPRAQQATIRVGARAYDNKSDEKYAGAVATQVLSNGIDSRLNRYLRAEKGLTYGSYGRFVAGRQGGSFTVTIDTKPETTGEAVAGIFTVLQRMRDEDVTPAEISEAKQRIAGGMVMDTQTADQQASRRVDVILNEYPDDYYEQFPKRIGEVEASQVRELMEKYADDEKVTIIVVAPASAVKDQLAQFGEVKVIPMPIQRPRRE
jgi:zinc protease